MARISRIGGARSHNVEFVLALTLNWLASARTAFCVGDEDILSVVWPVELGDVEIWNHLVAKEAHHVVDSFQWHVRGVREYLCRMAMHDTFDAVEALEDFAADEAFNEASGAPRIS
jgi:hypothetical protein